LDLLINLVSHPAEGCQFFFLGASGGRGIFKGPEKPEKYPRKGLGTSLFRVAADNN
jgi:hypothetical protein